MFVFPLWTSQSKLVGLESRNENGEDSSTVGETNCKNGKYSQTSCALGTTRRCLSRRYSFTEVPNEESEWTVEGLGTRSVGWLRPERLRWGPVKKTLGLRFGVRFGEVSKTKGWAIRNVLKGWVGRAGVVACTKLFLCQECFAGHPLHFSSFFVVRIFSFLFRCMNSLSFPPTLPITFLMDP